ncbi:DUF5790 family protein [Halalkalicoccus jeotgali]|uniref:Uncharacterized protein n=1 Tax=Halalkalicoccus jeotgali (strain DSM 18796 / CECT 7217 / JCM 14584 / KCTC 4019 / B3) TaxID=795797 RepID=D8J944_HALJB|nr:DUF5790 family protein [Halalkalicoccus jeotgali]ADJ16313.1 hypothetical protein HacjB3_14670 [Halalkalicoccus jeotgali B3]ELY37048.1 hypothetical protein C497_09903 [Halalkalicoccus jeotgali B3]
MSQSTLDEEDLLGEAASEIRADVEENMAAARSELPSAEAIWAVDSENTLGVLNSLKSALDTGDAAESLRDARKWFMVGERADAFEDPDALEAELDEVAALIETVEEAQERVGELASTVPELRSDLEEANVGGADGDAETETEDADETEE